MRLSLNIIKKYIDIPRGITPEDIKQSLSRSTVEVESVEVGESDAVFHIDNKSLTNRPDLWSHYGMARELAALYGCDLKPFSLYGNIGDFSVPGDLSIELKAGDLCPRYIGAVIDGITVAESPQWLREALVSAGIAPINNIVDITNYVLVEVGQPLHAFDADLLGKPSRIVVRKAKKGEVVTTLDGVSRKLDDNVLVVADSVKPIAVAGIMGGAETGVQDGTHAIVLESANFSAPQVRRASQFLNLKTESSIRFEKALHPWLAEIGMRRALQLIHELVPGARVLGVRDEGHFIDKERVIDIDHRFITRKIGQHIDQKRIISILEGLGFLVSSNQDDISSVTVPWWRSTGDITIPEDLIEEIARMYGYDNLKPQEQRSLLRAAHYQIEFEMEKRLKEVLALGCGMHEVLNYPWSDAAMNKVLGTGDGDWAMVNPPAPEYAYLQTTLAPNIMKNVRDNVRFFDSFALFECARVFRQGVQEFHGKDELPLQPKMVAGVAVGRDKKVFARLKGIIEEILSVFRCEHIEYLPDAQKSFLEPESDMRIKVSGSEIGYMGLVDQGVRNTLDCSKKQVAFFELDYVALIGGRTFLAPQPLSPIPKYPPILRDISYFVPNGVNADSVQKMILGAASGKLRRHEFFDIYVKDGNKSMSSHLVFQSDETTLTDKEIDLEVGEITEVLQKKGFKIR